jgi:hypothetical protein
VGLQLEPVAALASLGFVFVEPHPLNVGVGLGAHAAHHSVRVQSVHNGGVVLGSLAPGFAPQKEGILQKDKRDQSEAGPDKNSSDHEIRRVAGKEGRRQADTQGQRQSGTKNDDAAFDGFSI